MSISNVTNIKIDMNEMISKIREASQKNKAFAITPPTQSNEAGKLTFDNAMSAVKGVFDKVNTVQNTADSVKSSYLLGDKNVSMSEVLVATQKSKLAFEGLVTVRNKVLEAYKEIMNMPV